MEDEALVGPEERSPIWLISGEGTGTALQSAYSLASGPGHSISINYVARAGASSGVKVRQRGGARPSETWPLCNVAWSSGSPDSLLQTRVLRETGDFTTDELARDRNELSVPDRPIFLKGCILLSCVARAGARGGVQVRQRGGACPASPRLGEPPHGHFSRSDDFTEIPRS